MRDVTEMLNAYRKCSRNLWNVYFSKQKNIGAALDAFGEIRGLLFDALVVSKLAYEGEAEDDDMPAPTLRVVPQRSLILVNRSSVSLASGSWDQEKDMVVGPDDIKLEFLDYFDFSEVPVRDFHYYRCKVLSFPDHADYEGREALLEVSNAKVFHDELPKGGRKDRSTAE